MIDNPKVTPQQWIEGYSKACRMSDCPIRSRYVHRLIVTAPDGASRQAAKELMQ